MMRCIVGTLRCLPAEHYPHLLSFLAADAHQQIFERHVLQLQAVRYWDERERVPRPPSRLDWLFNESADADFRGEVRVSRAKFNFIGNMIRHHPGFAPSATGRRQASLRVQLGGFVPLWDVW